MSPFLVNYIVCIVYLLEAYQVKCNSFFLCFSLKNLFTYLPNFLSYLQFLIFFILSFILYFPYLIVSFFTFLILPSIPYLPYFIFHSSLSLSYLPFLTFHMVSSIPYLPYLILLYVTILRLFLPLPFLLYLAIHYLSYFSYLIFLSLSYPTLPCDAWLLFSVYACCEVFCIMILNLLEAVYCLAVEWWRHMRHAYSECFREEPIDYGALNTSLRQTCAKMKLKDVDGQFEKLLKIVNIMRLLVFNKLASINCYTEVNE